MIRVVIVEDEGSSAETLKEFIDKYCKRPRSRMK